jgi:threonine/homoserine/homoserine lactone efflux protein
LYGITLGLAAGIAPGPLLTLVISETIKGNKINGILIATAPLLTDSPIVLFSIYILKSFAGTNVLLGLLSLMGGVFLVYLGIKNLGFKARFKSTSPGYRSSFKYGVITNFLSPHPYLFWISIGAPTFIKASQYGPFDPFAFILGFYILLIGSKVVVAIISGTIKNFIQSYTYSYIMRFMGVVLLILACLMFYDGYQLLLDHIS